MKNIGRIELRLCAKLFPVRSSHSPQLHVAGQNYHSKISKGQHPTTTSLGQFAYTNKIQIWQLRVANTLKSTRGGSQTHVSYYSDKRERDSAKSGKVGGSLATQQKPLTVD